MKVTIDLKNKEKATLIGDIVKGKIADFKFNRDLAEELLKASYVSAKSLQVEISAIQSLIRTQTDISD